MAHQIFTEKITGMLPFDIDNFLGKPEKVIGLINEMAAEAEKLGYTNVHFVVDEDTDGTASLWGDRVEHIQLNSFNWTCKHCGNHFTSPMDETTIRINSNVPLKIETDGDKETGSCIVLTAVCPNCNSMIAWSYVA